MGLERRRLIVVCALMAALLPSALAGAARRSAARPPVSGPRRALLQEGDATAQVVGGLGGNITRLAYQAGFVGGITCGASVLRADAAITAKHCNPAPNYRIIAGTQGSPFVNNIDYDANGDPIKSRRVAKAVPHPDRSVDATLVLLAECFSGPNVRPIRMATQAEMAAAINNTWVVSGWGQTSGSQGLVGQLPRQLQFGYAKAAKCSDYFRGTIPGKEICAGNVRSMNGYTNPPYMDACFGDSGGPLTFSTSERNMPLLGAPENDRLVGIVSDGIGCGIKPGIYVSVPYLELWARYQIDAYRNPCGGTATPVFVNATAADLGVAGAGPSNWSDRPSSSALVPQAAAADPVGWCRGQCVASITADPLAGCVAFNVRLAGPGGAQRWCDMYMGVVPARPCAPADKAPRCRAGSSGAFRLSYAYTA